jgi:glycerol uptake facilitator-like aquaporin
MGLSRATARVALVELIATAFLLIAVVGSGVMAERLCGGNIGLALLANALATGGALVALILAFGPQSGAHMNPIVTLAAAITGGLEWHAVPAYIAAQLAGAVVGVWLAHAMFELPIWQLSQHVRFDTGQWIAEIVATFGLLMVIWGCRAHREPVTAFAVAAYITGGLLVHGLDLVRQSCRNYRPHAVGHVRRYSPDRCARFHPGADRWPRDRCPDIKNRPVEHANRWRRRWCAKQLDIPIRCAAVSRGR